MESGGDDCEDGGTLAVLDAIAMYTPMHAASFNVGLICDKGANELVGWPWLQSTAQPLGVTSLTTLCVPRRLQDGPLAPAFQAAVPES